MWKTCRTPEWVECDGKRHYQSIWDEDTNRWVPVEGFCPHSGENRRTEKVRQDSYA